MGSRTKHPEDYGACHCAQHHYPCVEKLVLPQRPEARSWHPCYSPRSTTVQQAILLQVCEPLAEGVGDGEREGAGLGEHQKRSPVHDTSRGDTVGGRVAHLLGILPMRRVGSRVKDRSGGGTERRPRRIRSRRPISRKGAARNRPVEPRSRCDTKWTRTKHRTRICAAMRHKQNRLQTSDCVAKGRRPSEQTSDCVAKGRRPSE